MMGDEMAVRSGGMYGNPESSYTRATPSSSFDYGQAFTSAGQIIQSGAGLGSAIVQKDQINANIGALRFERQYNVDKYKQLMADTLASNKMSFYSSGLDFKSGTAMDVIQNNQRAMEEDLGMMEWNYVQQEKNLKKAKKANRLNIASSIFQMGGGAASMAAMAL